MLTVGDSGQALWAVPSQLFLYFVWFPDENSNQSSVSDVYQLKVDSSTNSSPSPEQSESLSPAHTSDFRTDDSQPPTLGQEILEGELWECLIYIFGP